MNDRQEGVRDAILPLVIPDSKHASLARGADPEVATLLATLPSELATLLATLKGRSTKESLRACRPTLYWSH